jgi:integrase
MALGKHRLSAMALKMKTPGVYADGDGLFLQITTGTDGEAKRSWSVRFRAPSGKLREMGLGSAQYIALADARTKADAARRMAANGVDPIEHRDEQRRLSREAVMPKMTFEQAAEIYRKSHESGWKNEKHRQQWQSTLETYVYPFFGNVAIENVTVAHVTKVLDPIWKTKNETAGRLRGRIENILDWAAVRGYRSGDNPARWRGHLQKAMPPVRRDQVHHAALPYAEVADFIQALRKIKGVGALALEFVILTATRTNESVGARWDEIDLEKAKWTIPAARMKAGKAHSVPLSDKAMAILRPLREVNPEGDFIFTLTPGGEPISNMALLMTLRRLKRKDITVHGFRSTFRDWAAEQTDFPREVAEAALAHTVQGVESAYRRTNFFEKRVELMKAWSQYCFGIAPMSKSAKDTAGKTRRSGSGKSRQSNGEGSSQTGSGAA